MPPPQSTRSVIASALDPALALDQFAHEAMACTFEIYVLGEDADYARQVAQQAFAEVDRMDQELSRFIESSDVARINSLHAGQRTRVGLATLENLKIAARVNADTHGVFDVTVGRKVPLKDAAQAKRLHWEAPDRAAGQAPIGMKWLDIQPDKYTVGVRVDGLLVDLGGIAKGYTVDQMVEVLQDWDIETALIHGGQSTVWARGAPPGRPGWTLDIRDPEAPAQALGQVCLRDYAISGSGIRQRRHIIDPRTGRPPAPKLGAWAIAPSAALSDALSTAFMVMSADEVAKYCRQHPHVSAMLAVRKGNQRRLLPFGQWNKWFQRKDNQP